MAKKAELPSSIIENLKSDYDGERPKAERLLACVRDEMGALLDQRNVALGVPIEARIKDWESIVEKVRRNSLSISKISELQDLVGLRLILLFRRDLLIVNDLLGNNFDIIQVEDTAERLEDSQFGYQSRHYLARIKDEWLAVPRYNNLGGLIIEIQVRTLAQHMWAAASHKLQYKREESVPPPLRRTIYRVSALLEIVDLELDRVLGERTEYINEETTTPSSSATLDVDLVHLISKEILPEVNYEKDMEGFDEVLMELRELSVNTTDDLRDLLSKELEKVMEEDRKVAARAASGGYGNKRRVSKGGYFTHIGLIRQAMIERFGDPKYKQARKKAGTAKDHE